MNLNRKGYDSRLFTQLWHVQECCNEVVSNVASATNPLCVCTLMESFHFFTITILKYERKCKIFNPKPLGL